jgi:hypothetical protein
LDEKLIEITKKEGYEKALEYFCETKPNLIVKKYKQVKTNLKSYSQDLFERNKLVKKYSK